MFGFIHESIRQLMIRRHGEELWLQVLDRSGFENGKENIVNHYYSDADTYQLVDNVSVLTKMSREQVWELYGAFLIEYTMEIGWDELVRSMSPNLKGFLDNLDSLHYFIDHVVYKANLRGPSFRCEEIDDGTIVLHYFTSRPGLYPIVRGVLREVARRVFNIEISLTIQGRTQRSVQMSTGERVEEHVVFLITIVSDVRRDAISDSHNAMILSELSHEKVDVSVNEFCAALPYHIIMDEQCTLVQAGKELYTHIPSELLVPGTPIVRLFEINRPQIPFDFDNICNFINAIFVLQVKTSPADMRRKREEANKEAGYSNESSGPTSALHHGLHLKLKGQMMLLSSGKHLIYLCSPYVTSIPELMQFGMRLTAMPLHDATRDLILLNQQRMTDVEVNLQLEANNDQLEALTKELEVEKKKTDYILREMLPTSIAEKILRGELIEACEYDEVSVMYSDVPNFQSFVPLCQPKSIVALLNELFTRFDRLIIIHGVSKVETMGDSYITVCGLSEQINNHAEIMCHLGLGMIWEARSVSDPVTQKALQLRVGIHTGPIVAGVIEGKMNRYCLFGDTITTASLIETSGLPGKIHVSQKCLNAAKVTGRFDYISRGRIPLRGKGEMNTYFVTRSLKKSLWEIINRERDVNIDSIEGYDEMEGEAEQANVVTSQAKTQSIACSIS